MTGTSKATKAAAPAKASPAPASTDEAESVDDRLERLRKENELMTAELENRTLRARLGQSDHKTF